MCISLDPAEEAEGENSNQGPTAIPEALARGLSLAKKPAKNCPPTKNYPLRESADVKTRASTGLQVTGPSFGCKKSRVIKALRLIGRDLSESSMS
jgi:hypothetical protein